MPRRSAAERQRNLRELPAEEPSQGQPIKRRWLLLALGSVGTAVLLAVLVAVAVAFFFPAASERDRLRNVIAEAASGPSAESAALLTEAGEAVDCLLQQYPENGETLEVIAQLYRSLGKNADAVRCWQRAIELSPSLAPIVHGAMGALAYDEGDFEDAAAQYRQAMRGDPGSSAYPTHLGEALIAQGRLDEAVEVLEQGLKANPTAMPISALLGQAYLKLRQYEKARQQLESVVAVAPEYPSAFFSLATACARLGDQTQANEYLRRFRELQAEHEQQHREALQSGTETSKMRELVARTYRLASKVHLIFGNFQAGEAHLRRAAELDPHDTDSELLLAWIFEQSGRRDEAAETLDALCSSASDDLAAQMGAASAYVRLGRNEKAEQAFRRAIELTPQRGGGYAALADFLLRTGQRLDEAEELAQKAAKLEPAAENLFLLTLVRRAQGDTAGAVLAIDAAIELAPHHEGYQQIRRALLQDRPAARAGGRRP
jgi:tetratricopeptide (TPR) repeat protein